MAKGGKEPEFRHPDTVAYLPSLTEDEASWLLPMFREHDGGFTQYWLEDGEVCCRDITAAELPRSGGSLSALETLLSATRERFGALLPKLTAEAGRPVPGLDSIERVYFYCRDCNRGHHPLDRVLGIEGESHSPGAASLMADVVGDAGYADASRKLDNLAGVTIPPSTLHRQGIRIGQQVQRFEQAVVDPGAPAAKRLYLGVDGTGIPVRKCEVEGVRGKQADGSAKTREAKVLTIYTAESVHPETGDPEKDPGSEIHSGLIDSAAAVGGVSRGSAFAGRQEREIARQGLREAAEVVAISDAASWIRNVCKEFLPCGRSSRTRQNARNGWRRSRRI